MALDSEIKYALIYHHVIKTYLPYFLVIHRSISAIIAHILIDLSLLLSPTSRDWGYCLNNEPERPDFPFPEVPPGIMYNADHQCQLQYGHTAKHCAGIDVSIGGVMHRVGKALDGNEVPSVKAYPGICQKGG